MRVAGAFSISSDLDHIAVRTVDGKSRMFSRLPVRKIKEDDLLPASTHRWHDEIGPILYDIYGLVKVNERNQPGKACKFYHATDTNGMTGILTSGYIRNRGDGVYLCRHPAYALRFLIPRGIRQIYVFQVELPVEAVEESYDHDESYFGCKAYIYPGSIGIYGDEEILFYDLDKEGAS